MALTTSTTEPAKIPRPWGNWALIGAVLLLAVAAISTQSFWIDEACTGTTASQPTLADWWRCLCANPGTEIQMPLYMIYMWGWGKLFGCAEWVLRAANVPWLMLGFLALPRRQAGVVLAVLVSPFLWYYLDEARPYAMQLSASLMLAGGLAGILSAATTGGTARAEKFWLAVFCFGLVVLSGSSMLGMLWAGAGTCVFLLLVGGRKAGRLALVCWPTVWLTALLLSGLALYYLWTIRNGKGSTPGTTGVGNVIFIIYELCGFSGVGPGRNDIHGAGLAAFKSWYLVPLAVYGLVLAIFLYAGVGLVMRAIPRRVWLGIVVPVLGMTLLMLVAGRVRHTSILGRHCAPLAGGLLLLFGVAVQQLWQAGGWRRGLAVSWLGLNLISALSLRWCDRHAKDDYRTAARLAIADQAQGQRVWWCADGTTGLFYGVPLTPDRSPVALPGKAWVISSPPASWLTNNPVPTVVFLSKPEVHDRNSSVHDYLQAHKFVCQQSFAAFTVWTQP